MTALDTIKRAILGVPFDPDKMPSRTGTVQAFSEMQAQLEGAQAGALVFDTLTSLNAAGAVPSANIMAWVMNGADAGIYQNTGSALTPVWTRRGSIPQFLVTGVNVGAGTADAIQITTDIPVPSQDGRALILLPVLIANSADGPTVSINGGPNLAIVSNSGNAVLAGALVANSYVVGFKTDGNTKFRLVSDQASAAIVAAAEAAADRAEAAAATVDLPSVVADTVVAGNSAGTARINLTFVQLRNKLYLLDGISTSNAAANDTFFTTLETTVQNNIIDGHGAIIPVTSVPVKNIYQNASFKVANLDESAAVEILAENSLRRFGSILDTEQWNAAWPQGNLWSFNNGAIIGLAYSQGSSHTASDNAPVYCISTDKGRSWKDFKVPFKSVSARRQTFSTGQISGQFLTFVRTGSTTDYNLYGYRLEEIRYVTNVVTCTNASTSYRLYIDGHGLKVGDKFAISGAPTVAGQNINGTFTVKQSFTSHIRFTAPGAANADQSLVGGTIRVEFLQSATPAEILFNGGGGVSFAAACVAAGYPSMPGIIHTMVGNSGDQGTIFVGASGGGQGPRIIKVTEAFQTPSAAISWVKNINGISAGVEPALSSNPAVSGEYFGTVRTQDYASDGPPKFWYTSNIESVNTNAVVTSLPEFGKTSPIGVAVVGGNVYLCMTGNRTKSLNNGQSRAGTVNVYLLKASLADARAIGGPAFRIMRIDTVQMAKTETDDTVSVGVPGIARIDDNTLFLAYVGENLYDYNAHGAGNIHTQTIQVNRVPDPAFDFPVNVQRTSREMEHEFRYKVNISGGAITSIQFDRTPNGFSMDVVRNSTGNLTHTVKDWSNTTFDYGYDFYDVNITIINNNQAYSGGIQSQSGTGFVTVTRTDGSPGAVVDATITVSVKFNLKWRL